MSLKYYEVTNGYMGESYTRCYVGAENEDKALELASISFKKSARYETYDEDVKKRKELGLETDYLNEYQYPSCYWEKSNLTAVCLFDPNTDIEEFYTAVEDS